MLKLKDLSIVESAEQLMSIPEGKVLINTIYAYSYVVAQRDKLFAEALTKCDFLMPDGAGIVKACRWLKAKSQPKERIAGWDLFEFEMSHLNSKMKEYNHDFSIKQNFPNVNYNTAKRILPIYPQFHTNLLPDSQLKTENEVDFMGNVAHRYALQKV